MSKLTKRAVDALEPPGKGQAFLWDGELRGFGVRIIPSGLKTFVLQYRNVDGRSRRMVLGRYGVLTVEQARDQAGISLGQVAAGDDPAAESAASTQALTVSDLCDWYLLEAETGRILGRRRRPIKASTLVMDRSRIESHIKPLLGKRVVHALKLGDIEGAQASIAMGKTSKPRVGNRGGATTGGEGVAARTISTLHSIFQHAVRLGKIEANPAKGVRKMASEKRERRLSRTEIEKLGAMLRVAEAEGEHPTAIAAIRFMVLTGLRRMEALGVKRKWLDEEHSLSGHQKRRADPLDRLRRARSAACAAANEVRVLFPRRLGRRPLHRCGARSRPDLRESAAQECNAARAPSHLREHRGRAWVFRADDRRAPWPCLSRRHPALCPY